MGTGTLCMVEGVEGLNCPNFNKIKTYFTHLAVSTLPTVLPEIRRACSCPSGPYTRGNF